MEATQEKLTDNNPHAVGLFHYHLNQFEEARPWLWRAYLKKPGRIEYIVRLMICYFPASIAKAVAGSRRKIWHEMWESSLRLPNQPSLFQSGISEMAEFLKISVDEARARCGQATRNLAEEWKVANPQTPQEIMGFYQQNTTYIADLIQERCKPFRFGGHHGVEAVLFAKEKGLKSVLDFGSGDGSCSILYASNGLETSSADVSKHLLDFVRFRFAKRGLKGNFYLLPDTKLPDEKFDVITAFDTLEHVAQPLETLQLLYNALNKNGYIILNTPFGCTENHPMHLPHNQKDFFNGVKKMGFRIKPFTIKEFFVFQKKSD